MGEDINWDKFIYPKDCLLSDRAKAALIRSANEGRCPPFLQCNYAIDGSCGKDTQKECYNRGLVIKKKHKVPA